jgi:hypothetical protein
MPAIIDRSEDNAKRKNRVAKLRKGAGTFVYKGGLFDTVSTPQPLVTGANEPVFDAGGAPVIDSSGRQVYQRSGQVVRDIQGRPVLGGEPKLERIEFEVAKVRGVSFPRGEPVHVSDEMLALKLRGMLGFDEVEAVELVESDEPVSEAPKKRGPGRPRKEKAEAVEPEPSEV